MWEDPSVTNTVKLIEFNHEIMRLQAQLYQRDRTIKELSEANNRLSKMLEEKSDER